MMNRREFALRAAAFAAAAMCGKIAFADGRGAGFERVFAKSDSPKNPPIPEGRRSSGGLGYFRLDDDPDGVLLKFPKFSGRLKNYKNPKLKPATLSRCSRARRRTGAFSQGSTS